MARAERQGRPGGAHAFGDHVHPGEDLVQGAAAPEFDADVAVAAEITGAGQDEIPQPAEARQRLAAAPLRAGKA